MHDERTHDIALLLVRLVLAVVFVAHGGQKLFGWFGGKGMEGFAPMVMKMGLPHVVAVLVAIGEFFGGLGLGVGLLTRIAALGPLISMAGAIALVHGKNGFFLPNGFEYALTMGILAVAILIAGPGHYSLDAALRRERRGVRLPRALPV